MDTRSSGDAPVSAAPEPEYGAQIAANIRAEMARQLRTHRELAAFLEVNQTYLSRRMTGDVPWSAAEVGQVAFFLKRPVEELYDIPGRVAS